jgi:hypothetical protein
VVCYNVLKTPVKKKGGGGRQGEEQVRKWLRNVTILSRVRQHSSSNKSSPEIPSAVTTARIQSAHYNNCCSILIKVRMFGQILVKLPNIKFDSKSVQPLTSCITRTDRQTDGQTDRAILIGAPQSCKRTQIILNSWLLLLQQSTPLFCQWVAEFILSEKWVVQSKGANGAEHCLLRFRGF